MSDPTPAGTPAAPEVPRPEATASGSSPDEFPSTAGDDDTATTPTGAPKKRRRGSRGGRNRSRPRPEGTESSEGSDTGENGDRTERSGTPERTATGDGTDEAEVLGSPDLNRQPDELPERLAENRPIDPEVLDRALVRRPQIGDSRPAPEGTRRPQIGDSRPAPDRSDQSAGGKGQPGKPAGDDASPAKKRRRRGGRGRGGAGGAGSGPGTGGTNRGGRSPATPVRAALVDDLPLDLDEEEFERRRGRERKGRPVGRYLMAVHVQAAPGAGDRTADGGRVAQIAVLEGRALTEHYVSRPADDVSQIHGNIYLGRVQNVLPGMEAAFVDIGTPKNAVLYRGDVQYDAEDVEQKGSNLRIEQMLRARQTIVCQVTKNPIGAKGARLTQEVSLPGRFVVLIPNSSTYGISKRLGDDERKRLRGILDRVKPAEHGVIVRTAAENVTTEEIERDVLRLLRQWEQIDALAKRHPAPALLYREPDMAVRVIREEFNAEYRGVVIDDRDLFEEVRDYVATISPALADRVDYYDPSAEPLPLFERFHVHEQLHKALDKKVWLPSGGSLIIEHTEALTVIDVNTGKNVGTSSLEETVYRNNLEAAVEVARQLRLRDIGGIIVVDFIDMEIRDNREEVIRVFRDALARDKTRTQVFDISELGLVEMTRKRIGEGLLESFTTTCPECAGRGVQFDPDLFPGD